MQFNSYFQDIPNYPMYPIDNNINTNYIYENNRGNNINNSLNYPQINNINNKYGPTLNQLHGHNFNNIITFDNHNKFNSSLNNNKINNLEEIFLSNPKTFSNDDEFLMGNDDNCDLSMKIIVKNLLEPGWCLKVEDNSIKFFTSPDLLFALRKYIKINGSLVRVQVIDRETDFFFKAEELYSTLEEYLPKVFEYEKLRKDNLSESIRLK
jgi:hypothetical protein